MIIETIVMMISLRMLKKSHMTFPRSPILLMQMPKVMKKPIKPLRRTQSKVSLSKAAKFMMQSSKYRLRLQLTEDVHAPFVLQ